MQSVSVLMITYNRANLISESIQSVLNQTHSNFELIIIDDDSDDDTESVVNSFYDSRIKYFKVPKIGKLPVLRNIAFAKSSNSFIAILDSDDIWAPNKLEVCLNIMFVKQLDICLSDSITFKNNVFNNLSSGYKLKHLKNIDIKYEVLINNVAISYPSTFVFKKCVIEKQKFDKRFLYGDHHFLLRALYDFKSGYIVETLVNIRKHDTNISNSHLGTIPALNEYYKALTYIYNKKYISVREFKIIKSHIYFEVAKYYLLQAKNKLAITYWIVALRNDFKFKRLSFMLKQQVKQIIY